MGGNENTYSTLEKEKLVYDDENVAVYFNSIDINQMNFCIENKMGNAITVGFWGDEDLKSMDLYMVLRLQLLIRIQVVFI